MPESENGRIWRIECLTWESPESWVMVGHSTASVAGTRGEVGRLSNHLNPSIESIRGLRVCMNLICMEVRGVTEWGECEVEDWSDLNRTCLMSPDSLGTAHREVPTRGLNNIRHVLLSQPTLNILNLHYLSPLLSPLFSSDQAEHYVRSPDTFTIFSSQSARSITRPEFETILGFNRSIFLSKAQHGQ